VQCRVAFMSAIQWLHGRAKPAIRLTVLHGHGSSGRLEFWSFGRKCIRDHSAKTGLSITCLRHVPGLSGCQVASCKLPQRKADKDTDTDTETRLLSYQLFHFPRAIADSSGPQLSFSGTEFALKLTESYCFSYPVHVRHKWFCKTIRPFQIRTTCLY